MLTTGGSFGRVEPVFTNEPSFGGVAQLVEQRTENPCVIGSIPIPATTLNPCKTGVYLFLKRTRKTFLQKNLSIRLTRVEKKRKIIVKLSGVTELSRAGTGLLRAAQGRLQGLGKVPTEEGTAMIPPFRPGENRMASVKLKRIHKWTSMLAILPTRRQTTV